MMPMIASLFPKGPIDISDWLAFLPEDGSVPAMPGWRWIHTPGHTPGHVSLWRERDRTLIVGDAFVTTNQESIYAVLTQAETLRGPPAFMTSDWDTARHSVEILGDAGTRGRCYGAWVRDAWTGNAYCSENIGGELRRDRRPSKSVTVYLLGTLPAAFLCIRKILPGHSRDLSAHAKSFHNVPWRERSAFDPYT